MSADDTRGRDDEAAGLPEPLWGDRVFVLAMLLYGAASGLPTAVSDRLSWSYEHRLGGPTRARLSVGEHRYVLTIEDAST